jgi:ubiquinone/menaquinone biosynthesis C-methylase UbiE
MKTEWDYTTLADAYLERPDYADAAIDAMVAIAGVKPGDRVCDVGAGVAHLTLMLAARGLNVTAVEPNDAMRANGIKRTEKLANVKWHEGTGEETGQPDRTYRMVTFGSSFNVCDRPRALKETVRILQPQGWFACMWNHRDLEDPIQHKIESIIKSHVAGYGYGTRREDQRQVIDDSGLFKGVVHLDGRIVHSQTKDACVEAWRSHATLARQAGSAFANVVKDIESYLSGLSGNSIQIPYTTNIWIAQAR